MVKLCHSKSKGFWIAPSENGESLLKPKQLTQNAGPASGSGSSKKSDSSNVYSTNGFNDLLLSRKFQLSKSDVRSACSMARMVRCGSQKQRKNGSDVKSEPSSESASSAEKEDEEPEVEINLDVSQWAIQLDGNVMVKYSKAASVSSTHLNPEFQRDNVSKLNSIFFFTPSKSEDELSPPLVIHKMPLDLTGRNLRYTNRSEYDRLRTILQNLALLKSGDGKGAKHTPSVYSRVRKHNDAFAEKVQVLLKQIDRFCNSPVTPGDPVSQSASPKDGNRSAEFTLHMKVSLGILKLYNAWLEQLEMCLGGSGSSKLKLKFEKSQFPLQKDNYIDIAIKECWQLTDFMDIRTQVFLEDSSKFADTLSLIAEMTDHLSVILNSVSGRQVFGFVSTTVQDSKKLKLSLPPTQASGRPYIERDAIYEPVLLYVLLEHMLSFLYYIIEVHGSELANSGSRLVEAVDVFNKGVKVVVDLRENSASVAAYVDSPNSSCEFKGVELVDKVITDLPAPLDDPNTSSASSNSDDLTSSGSDSSNISTPENLENGNSPFSLLSESSSPAAAAAAADMLSAKDWSLLDRYTNEVLDAAYTDVYRFCMRTLRQQERVSCFGVTINSSDLSTLKRTGEITDSVINLVFELLQNYTIGKMFPEAKEEILLLTPSVASLITDQERYSDSELKMLLPPLNKSKLIFIPMNSRLFANDDGTHWSLLVISPEERVAYAYDSFNNANRYVHDTTIRRLRKVLGKGKLKKIDMQCFQQDNEYDCGIIVIQITLYLIARMVKLSRSPKLKGSKQAEVPLSMNLEDVAFNSVNCRFVIIGIIYAFLKQFNKVSIHEPLVGGIEDYKSPIKEMRRYRSVRDRKKSVRLSPENAKRKRKLTDSREGSSEREEETESDFKAETESSRTSDGETHTPQPSGDTTDEESPIPIKQSVKAVQRAKKRKSSHEDIEGNNTEADCGSDTTTVAPLNNTAETSATPEMSEPSGADSDSNSNSDSYTLEYPIPLFSFTANTERDKLRKKQRRLKLRIRNLSRVSGRDYVVHSLRSKQLKARRVRGVRKY